MKTVMIVDDEKPARELLKMLIDWEAAGYRIISEARDGAEAIEQYSQHAPDLIITDIQMPLMDGLSLIKEIKKINKDQPIIVLSCHENFSYAREVMKLGIFDYLIKDSLTPEDLYTILKNTLYSNPDSRNIPASKGAADEKKSQALWNFINRKQDKIDNIEALKVFNMGNSHEYYFIHALIDIGNRSGLISEITNKIYEILTPYGGAVCNTAENYFIILVLANTSHSQLEMLNQRFTTAQSIRACMEKITGSVITLGVSRISSDVGQLQESSLEAHQALGYRVFLGKGKILYFDLIQNNARKIKIELIETRIKNIKSSLSQKQPDRISDELRNLYLVDLQGIMQYNYLQHVNALLLGIITTACSEHNIQYKSLFTDGTVPLDIIQELETVEEMLTWFTDKFSALIKAICNETDDQYNYQTRKIVQYIKQHYAEDIGLDSIAKQFNIHKVHLARSFKENTGHSVNGYISELRIHEAKNLLKNSDLNVSEIVYKIGFQNFQSFYSFFKKQVGVTPMEFRDM